MDCRRRVNLTCDLGYIEAGWYTSKVIIQHRATSWNTRKYVNITKASHPFKYSCLITVFFVGDDDNKSIPTIYVRITYSCSIIPKGNNLPDGLLKYGELNSMNSFGSQPKVAISWKNISWINSAIWKWKLYNVRTPTEFHVKKT